MPVVLQSIDAIARQRGRDMLMVSFTSNGNQTFNGKELSPRRERLRREIMQWLDVAQIPYGMCFGFWSDELIITPYQGHLYLDVPNDPGSELYQRVAAHLENANGTPRIRGVTFWLVLLSQAMENAHHDTDEDED